MVHVSRVDLNLFVVLDAIYSEGGVTRAAEKLNLTQPAISHALGRLREMFDDPLFVRKGRQMVPSPLTRSLIEPVRQSLRGLEVALNDVGRFDAATAQQRFTIGMRDILESDFLPALEREIARQAPLIDLASIRINRRDLEAELADGTLDAAIDVLLPLSENTHRRQVARERMVVVARRDHPAIDGALDLDTYLAQQHILVTARRHGAGAEDQELARLGLHRRVRLRCQHFLAACWTVSQTDLLLTMWERQARMVNAQFGNQILPLPIAAAPTEFYLYWHATVENDPANRWLRDRLIEAFRAHQPGRADE